METIRPRRGRKPIGQDSAQFSLMLTGDMRIKLQQIAAHEGNSEASVVRRLLQRALDSVIVTQAAG